MSDLPRCRLNIPIILQIDAFPKRTIDEHTGNTLDTDIDETVVMRVCPRHGCVLEFLRCFAQGAEHFPGQGHHADSIARSASSTAKILGGV